MKKVAGYYIEEKVKKEFEEYCEKENLIKAKMIESLIKVFLERVKKK